VTVGTCGKADCTVATTGKCLLSQPDPADCPHFLSSGGLPSEAAAPSAVLLPVAPLVSSPEKQSGRRFHLGNELGTDDAVQIMRARYGHLIGVLGSTDAGKTCFLSSLYLMASGGTLPSEYKFAGSLTLQAFEDRARGLREWTDGKLPSQLADHTTLSDPRQPSLLHLSLRESGAERRRFDLLLTDLPGEWTDNLVLHESTAESFGFLRRADGIILVVDGTLLMSDQHRHTELQRIRYLCDRLANVVNISRNTPFVILVSKSDRIGMQMPPDANVLAQHAASLGFATTTISSAAFSSKPDEVKSGTGVFTAIQTIISHVAANNPAALSSDDLDPRARTFQRFRT